MLNAIIVLFLLFCIYFVYIGYQGGKGQKAGRHLAASRRGAQRITNPTAAGSFTAQVHGINYKNSDGTSRQELIGQCREGETVRLVPEPDNPYDEYAIKICRNNGDQLGYWERGDSRMAEELTRGKKFEVTIDEIYEFAEDEGKRNPRHGVRMRVGVARNTV